jgi:hypothetical protein
MDFHKPCGSTVDLPVEFQGGSSLRLDIIRLPEFYTLSRSAEMHDRTGVEGDGLEPTIVVEHFINVWPGRKCERDAAKQIVKATGPAHSFVSVSVPVCGLRGELRDLSLQPEVGQ